MIEFYTPTIDEFHVGFEYNYYNNDSIIHNDAIIENLQDFETLIDDIKYGNVRVKYLDKDDLDELGFTQVSVDNLYMGHFKQLYSKYGINKENKQYGVSIFFDNVIDNNYIKIYAAIAPEAVHGHLENSHCSFRGYIKNKSELVKLLKQIINE